MSSVAQASTAALSLTSQPRPMTWPPAADSSATSGSSASGDRSDKPRLYRPMQPPGAGGTESARRSRDPGDLLACGSVHCAAHRPVHRGSLFCAKASGPSRPSAVPRSQAKVRCPRSSAVSIGD